MKRYLTELIGTFFLVFTLGLMVVQGAVLVPLAVGSVLMVMVYMGGHISGAHYNPAVTLAVALRGAMDGRDVAPYMAAQVVGALLASVATLGIAGETFAPAPGAAATLSGVLAVEFLFTFALALVVLNSATSPLTENNSFYGLAIGFTVAAGAFAGGPISGGAFNPAVGVGPILVDAVAGAGTLTNLWIYLAAPLAGGAAAAAVFKVQHAASDAAHTQREKRDALTADELSAEPV